MTAFIPFFLPEFWDFPLIAFSFFFLTPLTSGLPKVSGSRSDDRLVFPLFLFSLFVSRLLS